MHKCNLSFDQANKYTDALVKAGYLDEEENPNCDRGVRHGCIKAIYTTTEDGWYYLNTLEKSRVGTEKVKKFL